MRTTRSMSAISAVSLFLVTAIPQSAAAQVVVDGQSTGVVINAQPPMRIAPVRRSYQSEYNPQTRARLITKQSAINDSQSQPRILQLTYNEPQTAHLITRQSELNRIDQPVITVRNDTFRVDPYYARRYNEYVPYYSSTRRNYSYSGYGYWAPYYYGLRRSYRTPYYGGNHRYRSYRGSCSGSGSNYIRYSGSGLRLSFQF